jgi:peptide methionine sulfoxide reductase MsrA
MNMMNKVFMDKLDKCVIVIIDDILVFSKTVEEHEEHLKKSPLSFTCCQLKEWL